MKSPKELGPDIPSLLSLQPSVVTTSDAGNGIGYSGIRVRGNDATRLNVTLNGVPVNDAESHQVYWVDLPDLASSVDNIQFQRGLGNSTNGAGAFGSSLNIQTTKFSMQPYGQISSSYGSFNSFKNTVRFGSGIIHQHFSFDGRLSAIQSDGYIDRASSDLKSLYLSGGYYDSKQSLRALIISGKEKTYQAWYGLPKEVLDTNLTFNYAGMYTDNSGNTRYYDNQTDNYQQDYYQLLYSRSFSPSITGNLTLHYTHGKGYYEEFQNKDDLSSYSLENVMIGDSAITNANLIRRKWIDNDFYGATWSVNYQHSKTAINFGGSVNHYRGIHFNELIAGEVLPVDIFPYEYHRDVADKNDADVFIRAGYDITNKLNVTADIQERMVKYSFTGLNVDFSESLQNVSLNFFNPKLTLTYKINPLQRAYLYVGQGHKEPVRDDYLVATSANRPQAESMTDIEAGYEFTSENFSAGINLYDMIYDSQLILTGKINDVGEYIRESVKDSYRRGAEIQLAYKFCRAADIKVNFTMSENKIKNYTEYVDYYAQLAFNYTNTDISFSPSIISGSEINFHPVKNLDIQLNGKYVGKQYLDNTSSDLRKLDPYFLAGVSSNWKIAIKGGVTLSLTLQVNNLFDKKYISNGYTYNDYSGGQRNDYNYYFPQAGRNWMVGVVIGF
ncbi:MAG: TonB-dependent receptor [Bacteroidia bacterium]